MSSASRTEPSAAVSVGAEMPGRETIDIRGVRIAIDPARMSERMLNHLRSGNHSQPEAGLMPKALEKGERFVELGGGVGYTSTLAFKTGVPASVTTFEANPDLLAAIQDTHALNGVTANVRNAIVVAKKTTDTVPFYISEHFWASSLIKPASGLLRVVDVPVISFAELQDAYSPTMLLVDIEGGELSLFDGVNLDGISKVMVEMHTKHYGLPGVRRLFDAFHGQGFCYQPRFSRSDVIMFRRLEA